MRKLWESPIYNFGSSSGDPIRIDVTTSVSPGLRAHKIVKDVVIPIFKDRGVHRVLDFGAGALRHSFPLLDAGFEVCGVEFEECYSRDVCSKKREKAEKRSNFCALVWPKEFLKDRRKFDAALLCYVLQVMPKPNERNAVLAALSKKIKRGGYLLYMSRFGQHTPEDRKNSVSDGAFKGSDREFQVVSTGECNRFDHSPEVVCAKDGSA